MKRCEVQGLLLGGCSENARPGGGLCYYHQKLADMVLTPPGDSGYFTDKPDDIPGSALLAHMSYLSSTYPEFAQLVDTGGLTYDLAAA